MRAHLIVLVLVLSSATTTAAQTQGPGIVDVAPVVLQLPGSTRALGLGGAYPVVSPDPDAIFYNPVLLQGAIGVSLSMQRYGSASTLTTMSAAVTGGFGFGLQILDYAPANVSQPGDVGSPIGLGRRGLEASGEVAGAVAYTRVVPKLPFPVRLGVAAKWAQHWGAGRSEGVAAFDVGSSLNPINWLTVALSVQNLGGNFEFGERDYDLPTRITLAASTRTRVLGPLDGSASGNVSMNEQNDVRGAVGVELSYWPFQPLTFFVRGGARFGTESYAYGSSLPPLPSRPSLIEQKAYTAGASVNYGRLSLDYAWEPFDGAANAHRFGLRVR